MKLIRFLFSVGLTLAAALSPVLAVGQDSYPNIRKRLSHGDRNDWA